MKTVRKGLLLLIFKLLRDRDILLEIIEDIEDEISVELTKDEPSLGWSATLNREDRR